MMRKILIALASVLFLVIGTNNSYGQKKQEYSPTKVFSSKEDKLVTEASIGNSPDSTKVAMRLKEMLTTFSSSKGKKITAEFVVYRGREREGRWTTLCNYANSEEQRQVNMLVRAINQSINKANDYQIVGYEFDKESEGVWHVLKVQYTLEGEEKEEYYAFLKINGKYALGDID